MKKLATIGIVFAGLLLSTGVAWGKPTGMTNAEYHALMVQSEGLNQQYGLGTYARPSLSSQLNEIGAWAVPSKPKVKPIDVGQKLEEIGAWAVPSTQKVKPVDVSQKLEEIGAWAVPTRQQVSTPIVSEKLDGLGTPESTLATTGDGFDWNYAGLGAGLALVGLLGVGSVLVVRHQQTPLAH